MTENNGTGGDYKRGYLDGKEAGMEELGNHMVAALNNALEEGGEDHYSFTVMEAVTASEVVDRETLITFVEEAARIYQEALNSDCRIPIVEIRNTFRVEGEDWKAGSIYLYTVSGGGVTLFHGSEPYRDGQTTDMTRTDARGVRFAEELIGSARREGRKFLRYHYDNPAIQGDEETGSPKLGYAVSLQMPNSDEKMVIGSGIYIDTDDE